MTWSRVKEARSVWNMRQFSRNPDELEVEPLVEILNQAGFSDLSVRRVFMWLSRLPPMKVLATQELRSL
jgi:hypothetical protein